jgi:2-dehydro-3-deoxyphosphogluconate aldolase / (4S)-4-hydroxy-2-oxoglutarate aldolase
VSAEQLIEMAGRAAIFPILTPTIEQKCLEVIEVLVEGGAGGIEIVLRSPDALLTLKSAVARFPDTLFAAGTVLNSVQLDKAFEAGARLAISPGFCPSLSGHAFDNALPFVPGVQTATEIIMARDAGARVLKFYPAEPAGGIDTLRDFASIFPDVRFMPSGKIKESHVSIYGELNSVLSIGGSWMHSADGQFLPGKDISSRMRRSLELFRSARQGQRVIDVAG